MSEAPPRKSNVVRQSLHLQGFEPERMEEIIRGGRFQQLYPEPRGWTVCVRLRNAVPC